VFKNLFCKKHLSPDERVARLRTEAKKLGIDQKSVTTSMGGMQTDHSELYRQVRDEKYFRLSGILGVATLISCLFNVIQYFK